MRTDPIVVRGSFPAIQRAISIGGGGEARLQLDIPASEIEDVIKLRAMLGQPLYITFALMDEPRTPAAEVVVAEVVVEESYI